MEQEKDFKTIQEKVKRVDEIRRKLIDIDDKLQFLEFQCIDNTELQDYIKNLREKEALTEQLEKFKDLLYDQMSKEDVKDMTIGHTTVVLSKASTRTNFNTKLFLEDYQPNSDMYKRYITISDKKGFVKFKDKYKKV